MQPASHLMRVDDADSLQERIYDGRSDELHATLPQLFCSIGRYVCVKTDYIGLLNAKIQVCF